VALEDGLKKSFRSFERRAEFENSFSRGLYLNGKSGGRRFIQEKNYAVEFSSAAASCQREAQRVK